MTPRPGIAHSASPPAAFGHPREVGHCRSLASEVNRQLREEVNDPTPPIPSSQGCTKTRGDSLNALATRVATKLKEGDYKGAVRLACSEESIADLNEETWAALKAKHPPPHPSTMIPPPPKESTSSSLISEEEVAQAIRSFPNDSAGGPEGLRPQHLKDLVSTSAERPGKELLNTLTSFINLVVSGKTPHEAHSTFFGASLIALRKKGEGVRPIAVGQTLRCLAAKFVGSRVLQSMGAYLAPCSLAMAPQVELKLLPTLPGCISTTRSPTTPS